VRDIAHNASWEDRKRYAQALAAAIGEYLEDDGPDLPDTEILQQIANRVAEECGIELVTVQ
jgi:hypothetical protein